MIDRKALLTDLKKQVGTLEGDLRERAADDADTHARLHGEWQQARTASRIAATYESWLDDRVTQAAVAWVLGTVFLRFCEDNGLIEMPFLAGPGERLDLAQERQAEYIRQNPHDTDRDWILAGFAEMSRSPVAAGLFDRVHNPMWQIEIPHHAAKALLGFWRRRDEDGEIVHDFTDPEWDTRFLGDLYQDLSEHAKKTYALLQTPEFVEEFILDYTLEPAVDEFGLAGLRLIDPTCGSGHFLLGAFHRILNKWRDAEPATDIWDLIRRTLLSVHGVDKNPFATNIARFRLLVAVMKAGGVSTLVRVPEFPIIVATGDSLLHGRGAPGVQEDLLSEAEPHTYAIEDIYDYISSEDEARPGTVDLLGSGSYHVVVGNPPYIIPKDKQERDNYRSAYKSCSGKYQLTVPFVERFFQLCVRGDETGRRAGYSGQITGNGFMKREFGRALIEEYLPANDLTYIIDTSGVYIPGHGTPTVVIIGRRRWPKAGANVRALMGIRGEPAIPKNAAEGYVWREIVERINGPEGSGEWIRVVDVPNVNFYTHPWNLSGSGEQDVVERLRENGSSILRSHLIGQIGFAGFAGIDDAFYFSAAWHRRYGTPPAYIRDLLTGDTIRDWYPRPALRSLAPYGTDGALIEVDTRLPWAQPLWRLKQFLGAIADFGGNSRFSTNAPWWAWYRWVESRNQGGLRICFTKIASHNYAVINSGDGVSNQHVLVAMLRAKSISENFGVLGFLNSSTVGFLVHQSAQKKAGALQGGGISDQPWSWIYEYSGAILAELPLPRQMPSELGEALSRLGAELAASSPSSVFEKHVPTLDLVQEIKEKQKRIRRRIVALQEELDWHVYYSCGLVEREYISEGNFGDENVSPIGMGERAFEIAMARRGNGEPAEWFAYHKATPTVELPSEWPVSYQKLIARRIKLLESDSIISLIERPEHKRRWEHIDGSLEVHEALKAWLLDRCEERSLWFANDEYGSDQPRVITVNQLADQLRRDEDFRSAARLYAGDDVELSNVIAEITQDEHVPHLAALCYKDPSGLRKRVQWEDVWEQQREEDRTGKRLDISVPPKYTSADFLKTSYWRNRGKLNVPKERFISYPGGGPDGDSSMLLGWAGWDHREQAQALMMLIEERATQDGWDAARLTPLLAGLAEVLPWVRQWHGEVDPAFGQSPADAYAMYLEDKQRTYGISDDDLKNWRPEKPKRGGRKKTS